MRGWSDTPAVPWVGTRFRGSRARMAWQPGPTCGVDFRPEVMIQVRSCRGCSGAVDDDLAEVTEVCGGCLAWSDRCNPGA